jgi:hypothetical protein
MPVVCDSHSFHMLGTYLDPLIWPSILFFFFSPENSFSCVNQLNQMS